MNELRVFRGGPSDAAALAGQVSPFERRRAARFRQAADRDRSLVAAALLRRAVAALSGAEPAALELTRWCRTCVAVGDHGRPVAVGFPDVHLSAAHAGDVVLVAATRAGPVGIDVERIDAVGFVEFDETVLTPGERVRLAAVAPEHRALERARAWTRKEALLKATGHGLAVAPQLVEVAGDRLESWPPALDADLPAPVVFVDVEVVPGHVASATVLVPR